MSCILLVIRRFSSNTELIGIFHVFHFNQTHCIIRIINFNFCDVLCTSLLAKPNGAGHKASTASKNRAAVLPFKVCQHD